MIIYYTDAFMGGREESHRLLERALSEYLGDPAQAGLLTGRVKKGEEGKPYIEGFDSFSISHTGHIWAVLIAPYECGLDIQLAKKCDVRAISKRIFDEADAAAVEEALAESPEKAETVFFRLWARREALVKAMGGSVYMTDLPSVLADNASAGGDTYTIADIKWPDMPELYAAVSVKHAGKGSGTGGAIAAEGLFKKLLHIQKMNCDYVAHNLRNS